MPYGINGVLGGAATLFFAYIGFDTVASTAEEVYVATIKQALLVLQWAFVTLVSVRYIEPPRVKMNAIVALIKRVTI